MTFYPVKTHFLSSSRTDFGSSTGSNTPKSSVESFSTTLFKTEEAGDVGEEQDGRSSLRKVRLFVFLMWISPWVDRSFLGRRMVRMRVLLLVTWVLFVAGVAAEGSPQAFGNETLADGGDVGTRGGNRAALKDLMGSGSDRMGGTVEECVKAIRRMMHVDVVPHIPTEYRISFPPEGFVPPGSREWCECIVADPPTTVPIWNSDESMADWDRTFDRCRALVLDGSEFNTVDICRGMLDFFTPLMRVNYHSFCGRMCAAGNQYDLDRYFETPLLDVGFSCYDECAAETMPGYCSKHTLTYGRWTTSIGFYGSLHPTRDIAVNDEFVGDQHKGWMGFQGKRRTAEAVCQALQPLLGSYNACCNYQRGFEALQICCSADENGKAVFDCRNTFGGRNLKYDCIDSANRYILTFRLGLARIYCERLISFYMESPEYGSAELFTQAGNVVVMFPQSFIDRWEGVMGGTCSYYKSDGVPFVANCLINTELSYTGPAVPPLSGPLEPADSGDPCMGACQGGRQCVLARNGELFCVECSAMLKKDAECCSYDEEKMICVSALKDSSLGKCKRDQNIFVDEGESVRATFKRSTGFVCASPRGFRRNGKACKVKVLASGVAKCLDKKL